MDSIEKISTAITLIEEARGVPLSASCVVHRGEILEILDGAKEALPQDLFRAEVIIEQRDKLIEEGRYLLILTERISQVTYLFDSIEEKKIATVGKYIGKLKQEVLDESLK